jgi:EAL domain-containing protein (putative c-di-GMP-specific phosphodiesterase class I)
VHFQPTLDLATGTARSAEALARWRHGDHGMVSPSEFVPLAEQYGMGLALFRVVLERSLAQLARWRRDDLLDVCAVNLSPHVLLDPGLIPTVSRVLADSGVPASAVVFEITEDSFIDDTSEVAEAFHALRRLGVHLAIDDFVAGIPAPPRRRPPQARQVVRRRHAAGRGG